MKKSTRRLVLAGVILAVAVLNAYGSGASKASHFSANASGHARTLSEE